MSAIAQVLLESGYDVSGSDEAATGVTAALAERGAAIHVGHAASHLGDVDVVVASSAVRPSNPEIVEATRRGIPVVGRGDMLAEIMRPRFGIAIAGAHGKTTTSAMVAVMLQHAGFDPTALIGGRVPQFGGNARVGASEYLVAEADESDRSFLMLMPAIAVVTNIDEEHLESYGEFSTLLGAFATFAGRVPFYGAAVLCADDPHVRSMARGLAAKVVTYGIEAEDASLVATAVTLHGGGSTAAVSRRDAQGRRESLGTMRLQVPGRHNVQNGLAALAVGLELGAPFEALAAGLAEFRGTERRFELKGEVAGVRVVDDYGHHPTEITAVLQAARAGHAGRIVVAFQPHRYSRTRHLREAFGRSLAAADVIVLADIYAAGEAPLTGVTLEWFAEAVEAEAPGRVHVAGSVAQVPSVVAGLVRPGDLVITLGAGSIGEAGPRILEEVGSCR
jgi:UDP-N-acetylmuramate--alanine ligase